MNKTNNTLRWIGVIPCALIAAFIVQSVISWLITSAYRNGYGASIDSSIFLSNTVQFIAQLLIGYCFVSAGTWCAPARKREVAIALAILTSLATSMNIMTSGYLANSINYAIVAGRIVGAILAVLKVRSNITVKAN